MVQGTNLNNCFVTVEFIFFISIHHIGNFVSDLHKGKIGTGNFRIVQTKIWYSSGHIPGTTCILYSC